MSLFLTDHQLSELFEVLLGNMQQRSPQATASVQAIGVIAFVVGSRAGKHAAAAIPAILSLIQAATEEDVEPLESCIRAIESFVSRCPLFVHPYLERILEVCSHFLHFDPNYADDMDLSDDMDQPTEEDEDDMLVPWQPLNERVSAGIAMKRRTVMMKMTVGR